MPALFIAGTGTDIGKTYVTAALLRALMAQGRAVDALKPVVSGFDEVAPAGSDPAVLLEAMGLAVTPDALARISPWRYRAPLAPNQAARLEDRSVDAATVIALCRERIRGAGDTLLVIESAGGIMSPLDDETTMLDLARALGVPVVLVAGSYLGTISHTLTAVDVILRGGLTLQALVVSESEAAPPLDDACDEIGRRLGFSRIAKIARGGDAGGLAVLLSQA